jgi:ABC-type multidrug transport system ATPase subunit
LFLLELENITKRFAHELIFKDFSLSASSPSSIAILGANGSGKSTLLQIMAGYVSPTKGVVRYSIDGKQIAPENQFAYISYCAPSLELIEELSLTEFLEFHFQFKKPTITPKEIIDYIGLELAKDKALSQFSSGMKQRVKLAQAIFTDAPLLFLDEPCTNLDEQGYDLYRKMITQFCKEKLVLLASNDKNEYAICKEQIHIMNYK